VVDARRAVLFVGVDDDLGVGREAVPLRCESPLQRAEVVDLAVERSDNAAVFVAQRLRPATWIDDLEAAYRQTDWPGHM
jgi:hypothetical protein